VTEEARVPDAEQLERLVAEAEIRRVVARYCRGVDRLDLELVRSCYHDDARDEHGSFSGTVDEYLVWLRPLLAKYDATMHLIGNQLVEFDDRNTAWVETYGVSVHRSASGAPHLNLSTGFRFVDRFERRAGEWRIAHRVAVADWSLRHGPDDWWPLPEHHEQGRRDGTDVVFRRPPRA
jgi:SnoaL-like protein